MNTIVIYKSHYGFTERYAHWIAEELSAELVEADKIKAADLQKYDTIVYGGGLYAGGVSGLSLITKQFDGLRDKSLYLFTVGAADVTDAENITNIRASLTKVLTPHMQEKIKIFHLRGGMCYSKMSFIHKAMMGMMRKMLQKKQAYELRKDEKAILDTYGQDIDLSDRQTISELVQAIKAGA